MSKYANLTGRIVEVLNSYDLNKHSCPCSACSKERGNNALPEEPMDLAIDRVVIEHLDGLLTKTSELAGSNIKENGKSKRMFFKCFVASMNIVGRDEGVRA